MSNFTSQIFPFPGNIDETYSFPGIPAFSIEPLDDEDELQGVFDSQLETEDEEEDPKARSNHFSIVTSPFLYKNRVPLKAQKSADRTSSSEVVLIKRPKYGLPAPKLINSKFLHFSGKYMI